MDNIFIKKFRLAVSITGLLLALATAFVGYELTMFSVRMAVWASVPYIIFLLISAPIRNNSAVVGAGILILGLDIFIHVYVIFFPGSSTDAIALLFMPFWLIVIFMPIGFLGGWLMGKTIQKFRHK